MTCYVWRQDNNGNRFLVGSFPSRDLAEQRIAELTRGHHKQAYWVSESGDTEDIQSKS